MPYHARLSLFLLLASAAGGAQTPLHLIPMPRVVSPRGDQPLPNGVQIVCSGCDADDSFAAHDLRTTLEERGVRTEGSGLRIVLERLAKHPDASFTPAMQAEGYTITFAAGTLTLTGATAEGVFYAAQTVKQLFGTNAQGEPVLHAATIRDWPVLRYRGLSDDLSRGPVDTLEFQKKLVRTLAAYKENIYSPYFEHTQQYASNPLAAPPGGSISAADARELVAYAKPFHVTVIPEQEAFGHLHHSLVYEQYQDLAETPHGAVLAPGQPGSTQVIQQEFGELAQLYPGPFLHVGADETVDLGVGRTKAAVDAGGLAPVYLDFMQRIDTALLPLHRKLLFWGDIAQNSPDLLKSMSPQFKATTVAVPWWYEPRAQGFSKYIKPFTDAGFETWVAPGINNWSRVYPNWNYAFANIQQFTRDGVALGATGQLNTIWYDDGEALASNNWYGILYGAEAAWGGGKGSVTDFQAAYGPVFHGDTTGKLDAAQQELMAAHDLLKLQAKVGDGSDGLFWIDPWSKDGMTFAPKLRPYIHDLRLHAEKALQLIAEARASYPALPNAVTTGAQSSTGAPSSRPADRGPQGASSAPWGGSPGARVGSEPLVGPESLYPPTQELPSNPTRLREPDAIDALELGARRLDFIGLKFQLADEMAGAYARAQADATSPDKKVKAMTGPELSDIRGINGRLEDIVDAYSLTRDLYQQLWLRTDRPYALRPVLEHYDYTIGLWYARIDALRSAQRQWENTRTLPPAAQLGIPSAPASAGPTTATGPD